MTAHDELPKDLRHTADRLTQLGERERAAGAPVADRVVMRTAHTFREPAAPPLHLRLGRPWMWLALPAAAAAALLITLTLLNPAPARGPAGTGAEMLAATLEHDIDALLAMDAMWRQDSFEDSLALLSLDAAAIATRTDDDGSFPAIESDL